MTTDQIIGEQMNAYDSRDIERMMQVMGKEIKIINFPDGKILVDGFDACKKMFAELFRLSPNLRTEIINRISFDNKVIVHENVYGRNGSDEKLEQVLIFEVTAEKITRIDQIRKNN